MAPVIICRRGPQRKNCWIRFSKNVCLLITILIRQITTDWSQMSNFQKGKKMLLNLMDILHLLQYWDLTENLDWQQNLWLNLVSDYSFFLLMFQQKNLWWKLLMQAMFPCMWERATELLLICISIHWAFSNTFCLYQHLPLQCPRNWSQVLCWWWRCICYEKGP